LLAPKHVRSPVIESWVALVTNGRKQGGGDATRRALTKRKPCWAHLDGTDGFLRVNPPNQQTPDSHAFGARDLLTKSL